jgi:hypothetical protein
LESYYLRVKFAVTPLRQQEELALGAVFTVQSSGAAFAAAFSRDLRNFQDDPWTGQSVNLEVLHAQL